MGTEPENGSARLRPVRGSGWAWIPPVLVAGVLAVALLSEAPARLPFTVCIFRNATGLPCPGCGLTRSLTAAAHGRWAEAWRLHPFGPVLLAGGCAYLAMVLWQAARGRGPVRLRLPRRAAAAACLTLLAAALLWWGVSIARHWAHPDASPPTLRGWLGGRSSSSAERLSGR